jgi:hypothetical protein
MQAECNIVTTPNIARCRHSGPDPRRSVAAFAETGSLGAMTKSLVFVFLLLWVTACSKSSTPTGIATWDEIRSLAEAFVFRGDSDAICRHTDFASVPPDAVQKLKTMLDDWNGVPSNLTHTGTQVMSFPEYEALRRDDKKELPEDMRNAFSALHWNVKPEKVIVFTFASKDPKDTATRVRWSAGTYQTNGLWFFAAGYTQ